MKINLSAFPTYIPEDRQDNLPEVLGLSGGRSSAFAYMALINGGFRSRDNQYAIFDNMGKEDETCYKFLYDIEQATGFPIKWLEYSLTPKFLNELILPEFSYDKFNECRYSCISQILDLEKLSSFTFMKSPNNFWYKDGFSDKIKSIKEVDYFTASRNGKPFADLFIYKCAIRIMKDKGLIMPSVGNRWCTGDGKEKVSDRWLSNNGIKEFISYKGMRIDEPNRIAKVKVKNTGQDKIWYDCPLEHTKTRKIDVVMAWAGQSIDLGLKNTGVNEFIDAIGNCDYCHLKKKIKKLYLIQQGKSPLFFKQIETICNNYNKDVDSMSRQHGTIEMMINEANSMPRIDIKEVLSDEEYEVSCFGCGD
jgi:hypothetical protein